MQSLGSGGLRAAALFLLGPFDPRRCDDDLAGNRDAVLLISRNACFCSNEYECFELSMSMSRHLDPFREPPRPSRRGR